MALPSGNQREDSNVSYPIRFILLPGLVAMGLGVSSARAFDPGLGTFSSGEVSAIQSCFYECKQDQKPADAVDVNSLTSAKVLEDTLLMLINESPTETLVAFVYILDAHENVLAKFVAPLSPFDLDVVNICETLEQNGIAPPQAGVLEIGSATADGMAFEGGIYAWVKNLALKPVLKWGRPTAPLVRIDRNLGRSRILDLLPRLVVGKVHKKVVGVGKTECRMTPPEVADPVDVVSQLGSFPFGGGAKGGPSFAVFPAYAQDSFDDDVPGLGTCSESGVTCADETGTPVTDAFCPGGGTDVCTP